MSDYNRYPSPNEQQQQQQQLNAAPPELGGPPSSELVNVLKFGNQIASKMVQTLGSALGSMTANNAVVAVSSTTFIASTISYVVQYSVTSTSTSTGMLYDCASVANIGSTNAFAVIFNSGTATLNWPILQGLVVAPGAGQTVSISYI